ncbi:Hypothetical predicted protein, partial [Paramuricea clavata]
ANATPDVFAINLSKAIKQQAPPETNWHIGKNEKHFVPTELNTCTHVYLRVDSVQPSLKKKFTGPHQVISRSKKVFIIDLGDRQDSVSIDRIKPAFLQGEETEL